jgi:CTP synthase
MQAAVIEFSRHIAGIDGATSSEFNPGTEHPVIALITEWTKADGTREIRTEDSELGGTMRLGAEDCHLTPGSRVEQIYETDVISERHRHRWEFNNDYQQHLEDAGLCIAGRSADGTFVEVVEVEDHPWFVGCQFHPEFTSTPRDGHPLFTSFVNAAITYSKMGHKEHLFS